MPVRNIRYVEPAGPNWAARAMAKPEAIYRAQVMEATFGHLSPVQGRWYVGYVTFTISCTGDQIAIDYEFRDEQGRPLDSSPWLYDDINEALIDRHETRLRDHGQEPRGRLFQWVGSYKQFRTTGRACFRGEVREIELPHPFNSARLLPATWPHEPRVRP